MNAPSRAAAVCRSLRLPFVLLTPACVVVGLGTALASGATYRWWQAALVLTGAVAAHLSVNTFNEYGDFRSGLDSRTTRTPFSGGSGALPAQPAAAPAVLMVAWGTFAVSLAVGGYFALRQGWHALPLLAAGLVLVATYTPWITRHPWLCLVAPGLGFGPLMVLGTHFALAGQYAWSAAAASLVPFFLVNNILLLNQFPDVEPDRSVGRRHVVVWLGRRAASRIYVAMLGLTYVALAAGVLLELLPRAALLSLATLVLAVPLAAGALRHAEDGPGLLPYLKLNILVALLTPALLGVGLLWR